MLMQVDLDSPPIIEFPWWEVQTERYPKEEIQFGDIVFLRYNYKNVSNNPLDLDYGHFMLFQFALRQNEKEWYFMYVKDGLFGYRGPGACSLHHVLVHPGDTFVIYEAILMPSPARDQLPFRMGTVPKEPEWHPFWNFLQDSHNKYYIEANTNPWHQTRFRYLPNRMPVTIANRPRNETPFLKDWYDKHLDKKSIQNTSVFSAVDPILTNTFNGVTPEDMQVLLNGISTGTFRDLVWLNASLGLNSVENPEKPFIESYQSPSEEFWEWFDGLPELERNFFAIAVVRAYCSRILSPTFPEWITLGISSTLGGGISSIQESVQFDLEKSEQEYVERKRKYDQFIADWMPRLPKESGESTEIVRLLQRLQKVTGKN